MDAELLAHAASLLRQGKLVAFPTETVYGLGANALDVAAVEKIFRVKGRPSTSPLIVHVHSVEQARNLIREWPWGAERLARAFWPGPLTLVLPKHPRMPDVVTAGLPTVAIRVPAHPLALALLREAGVPVAAPSANRFGELSPTTAEHVRKSLGDSIDLILDGGPCAVGIESTVLSLANGGPRLLRPGMIPVSAIEKLIGGLKGGVRESKADEAHPSPGMHRRHYSPRTPLVLVRERELPGHGKGVYLGPHQKSRAPKTVAMPTEPAEYAAKLYQVLHQLDGEGWDWIAVELPPETAEWAGILDRLRRASEE